MQMGMNPIENAHDRLSIELWAKAVGIEPSSVFNYPNVDNVFQYASVTGNWFVPDYDGDTVIDNERLENFRLAVVHDRMSNLNDLATHLDDDFEDTLKHLEQLMSNNPDANGNQAWLVAPASYSIVLRTFTRL